MNENKDWLNPTTISNNAPMNVLSDERLNASIQSLVEEFKKQNILLEKLLNKNENVMRTENVVTEEIKNIPEDVSIEQPINNEILSNEVQELNPVIEAPVQLEVETPIVQVTEPVTEVQESFTPIVEEVSNIEMPVPEVQNITVDPVTSITPDIVIPASAPVTPVASEIPSVTPVTPVTPVANEIPSVTPVTPVTPVTNEIPSVTPVAPVTPVANEIPTAAEQSNILSMDDLLKETINNVEKVEPVAPIASVATEMPSVTPQIGTAPVSPIVQPATVNPVPAPVQSSNIEIMNDIITDGATIKSDGSQRLYYAVDNNNFINIEEKNKTLINKAA